MPWPHALQPTNLDQLKAIWWRPCSKDREPEVSFHSTKTNVRKRFPAEYEVLWWTEGEFNRGQSQSIASTHALMQRHTQAYTDRTRCRHVRIQPMDDLIRVPPPRPTPPPPASMASQQQMTLCKWTQDQTVTAVSQNMNTAPTYIWSNIWHALL